MGQTYDDQLATKRSRLDRSLALYPHLGGAPAVRPARYTEAYRHRLKLPVHGGRSGVAIGLYGPDRQVLDTPDCGVLHPALRETLDAVKRFLAGKRGVHSVDLRVSSATGEVQAIFACAGGDLHGGPRGARALMRSTPHLASVAVSTADRARKRVMGSRPRVVAGKPALDEAIGDTRYRLYPGAFFQTDPRNAGQIHDLVREMVGEARSVLDLYAGVGAYARMLAGGGRRVVAVEEVPQAAEAARHGAPRGLEVRAGRVEDQHFKERFDAVVLNPARRGSEPAVLARLARLSRRLVYVSCGPESLARDLDCLAAHGLRVKRIEAVDLFPQTAEVEAVVLLEPGKARESWVLDGTQARGPWLGKWSGATGRATELVVLVVGDAGYRGQVEGGRYQLLGRVAGHALLRVQLKAAPHRVIGALAARGLPLAGRHGPTQRFFREHGGLVRPFVHVSRCGSKGAPLHGDLVATLEALGASPKLLAKAGARRRRAPRWSVDTG